jgi:hypothetical protein
MRSPFRPFCVAVIVLLSGCSSGGGDDGGAASSCAFVRGDTSCSPIVGGCNNTVAVGDGNLSTFGTFSAQASGGFLATGGDISFSGARNPGLFLTPPSGMTLADITVATYMDADNTVVESATGPALTATPTHGDPATDYISFNSTLPFNGVKLIVNNPNLGDFLVFEFCGAATVR